MKKSSKDLGISKKFSIIRQHFGLSAAALGEKAGVSGTAIASIERGDSLNPGAEVLANISTMLGINLNWLVLGEGEMLKANDASSSAVTGVTEPIVEWQGQKYRLTSEQWEIIYKSLLEQTAAQVKTQVELDFLGRTYHFGDERTPGLPYDDRVSMRIGALSKQEMKEWMESPDFKEARCAKIGNRLTMTERAIRELLGDIPKQGQ